MKELKNWEALRALEEGQEVEYRKLNDGEWEELGEYHRFPFANIDNITYRLKPNELPKTWGALKKIKGYWVAMTSKTHPKIIAEICDKNKHVFATKEQAEASIALAQLSQLMQVYNKGWVPDWTDTKPKHTIAYYGNDIFCDDEYGCKRFLAFKTEELRDLFLKNFEDLIKIAKPLL